MLERNWKAGRAVLAVTLLVFAALAEGQDAGKAFAGPDIVARLFSSQAR